MKDNKYFSFNHNTPKNRYDNFNSIILPFFQSDKWINKYKDKVNSESSGYRKYLDKEYIKYKNKIKIKKEQKKKKTMIKEEEEYKENLDESFYKTTTNLFAISDVNKLQQCSLKSMFPDFKRKTSNNFYNKKMRESKIKRINLFPKNDYNFDDLISKGIKIFIRGTSEEKDYQKKKYLDYLKRPSEYDYMKYYYNCYG